MSADGGDGGEDAGGFEVGGDIWSVGSGGLAADVDDGRTAADEGVDCFVQGGAGVEAAIGEGIGG